MTRWWNSTNKFIYKDYLPANARIIVDYKAKDPVTFSYPREWSYRKAVWKMGYSAVAGFWLALHLPIVYLVLYIFIPGIVIYFFYLLSLVDINELMSYETTSTLGSSFNSIIFMLIFYGFIFFYLLGIPAIITWYLSLNKERLSKWIPKMGYWATKILCQCKEMIITTKDIKDNKAVLSAFKNVYLNYEPTGDFEKYLEKIEVLEIPFNFKKRRFFIPFLKKKTYNDFIFRAVFFFSKKPIKGEMKVEFV